MTPYLLAYALSTPWAMSPDRMSAFASVLAAHYAGHLRAAGPSEPQARAQTSQTVAQPGIAVVPVMGAMVEWDSQIDMCEGGTSARTIIKQLNTAASDDAVGQILMPFNTPGGSVFGIPELGGAIQAAKAKKPVIGVATSLAASAGYWALSQCTEAYCVPGGQVGSIGVYSAHENVSEALKMAGVSIELFSAGKFKTEGHPFGPLDEDARAQFSQVVQGYYTMFTKAVAKGRNVSVDTVRNGMGQGRTLIAEDALAEGMIDGVMTLDEVVAKMQRDARRGRTERAARASQLAITSAEA
jgi:signal peptide peptidase SppA